MRKVSRHPAPRATINPGQLLDPATLQSDLAQDGIPAMVTTGT